MRSKISSEEKKLLANDALETSLSKYDDVKLNFMSELSGLSKEDLIINLHDKLFFNPINGTFHTEAQFEATEDTIHSFQLWVELEQQRIVHLPNENESKLHIAEAERTIDMLQSKLKMQREGCFENYRESLRDPSDFLSGNYHLLPEDLYSRYENWARAEQQFNDEARSGRTHPDDLVDLKERALHYQRNFIHGMDAWNVEHTPLINNQSLDKYEEIKRKHPDAIVLFRFGDFYEVYNQDVKPVAETLKLNTTQASIDGHIVDAAGFPKHKLQVYLPKLVRAGLRVAICDKNELNEGVKKMEGMNDTIEHKPRDPQMVTVNGQKVTHAHAYQAKDGSGHWFFTARLDGAQLKPQRMSKEDAEAYQSKNKDLTIQSLMERYYPTKLQEKVPDEAFRFPNVIPGNNGTLTIEKFNVYKEKDIESIDFGKWMFYAQIDGRKMSTPGNPALLNAYFDRTMTPGQIAEQAFGPKLRLRSYYDQFRLPDTLSDAAIKIAKDKEDGKWKISADFGEKGQTTKRTLTFDDGAAFFKEHTASKEQLAAKYLLPEIKTLMAQQQNEQIAPKRKL